MVKALAWLLALAVALFGLWHGFVRLDAYLQVKNEEDVQEDVRLYWIAWDIDRSIERHKQRGEPLDYEALAALEKAKDGKAISLFSVAVGYELGQFFPVDRGAAMLWYERAAEAGHPWGAGGDGFC